MEMDKKVQQDQHKNAAIAAALKNIDTEIEARRFGNALDLAYKAVHDFPETRPLDLKLGFLLETCKEWQKAVNVLRHVHEHTQKGGGKTEVAVLISIAHCMLRLDHAKEGRKLL